MSAVCPRCRSSAPRTARFCGHCGLSLEASVTGTPEAGRVRDPRPTPIEPDFVPAADAVQLYFRCESALGGQTLIGTEGLKVELLNAGYGLINLVLTVRGEGRDAKPVLDVTREVAALPKGARVILDIPSYELHEELRQLRVRLVSAEFEPASGASGLAKED